MKRSRFSEEANAQADLSSHEALVAHLKLDNAAERSLRGLALGRKAWLFAGSDRGAERAAVMNTLIMTARLNDIDPKAWFADVFACIADHPQTRLHDFLPWVWKPQPGKPIAAQAA